MNNFVQMYNDPSIKIYFNCVFILYSFHIMGGIVPTLSTVVNFRILSLSGGDPSPFGLLISRKPEVDTVGEKELVRRSDDGPDV